MLERRGLIELSWESPVNCMVELPEWKDRVMGRNILPEKQVRVRGIPISIMICIRVGI